MTNITEEENRISDKLNLSKFPLTTTQYYQLDISQDWVKALLIELNEKAESQTPEEKLKGTELNIQLELTKLFKPEYGEYLLVKGSISTEYTTICVRTLEEMKEQLDLEFSTCFLHQRFETDESFTEQMEIFEKEEMYELYFYNKGHVHLAEMLHEIIYLNLNQYPIKDKETPLHWANGQNNTKQ